jgi:peptide deformylase
MSEETIMMKEGCLTFPFIFLAIKRPKWVYVRYEDEDKKVKEEHLHGMSSRIFQHENEHMNGYIFTDLVSKFKLDRAKKKAQKEIGIVLKRQKHGKTIH